MNGSVEGYLRALAQVVDNLPREALEKTIEMLLAARDRNATIFVVGNGGSASTASHMANDINKLTIVSGEKRFRCLALTDNVPLITAWSNDNGYETAFVQPMLNFLQPGDVVIGITTSGNSPNVVAAMQVAQEQGATTILFGGADGGRCGAYADLVVLTPTDHQGMQEDCHLIFNHVVANVIRERLQAGVTV